MIDQGRKVEGGMIFISVIEKIVAGEDGGECWLLAAGYWLLVTGRSLFEILEKNSKALWLR